jgi:hypothetical protein
MSRTGGGLRVHLLNFLVDRAPILAFLDTRPEILNWLAVSGNSVLIVSKSDVTAITALLHFQFPWLWFLITEVDRGAVNGWANREVWDFINNPKSSGRWT